MPLPAMAIRDGAREAQSSPMIRSGRWSVVPNSWSPPCSSPSHHLTRRANFRVLRLERLLFCAIAIQPVQIGADVGESRDRLVKIACPLDVALRQQEIFLHFRPDRKSVV